MIDCHSKVPNAGVKVPNAVFKVPNAGFKVPNVGFKVPKFLAWQFKTSFDYTCGKLSGI